MKNDEIASWCKYQTRALFLAIQGYWALKLFCFFFREGEACPSSAGGVRVRGIIKSIVPF